MKADRTIVASEGCNDTAPLKIRVVVHGEPDGPMPIGALTFERAWSYLNVAMSKDDLARLRDAITQTLFEYDLGVQPAEWSKANGEAER